MLQMQWFEWQEMDIQLKVQKEMKKQVQVATQGPTQMT